VVWASGKDTSLERCFRHGQLGGDLGEDPELGGDIISPHCLGNASGYHSQSWQMWLGKEKFGVPCWNCCPRDPTSDKRMKMDG